MTIIRRVEQMNIERSKDDEIKRLRADLAEAIEALKPFAAIKNIANHRYDPTFVMTPFTFEDCEHASTIVEKHK